MPILTQTSTTVSLLWLLRAQLEGLFWGVRLGQL